MRVWEVQKEVISTLRDSSRRSSSEKKRAYMFAVVYVLAAVAMCGTFFHFIAGWAVVLILQVVMVVFSIMYALTVNEYVEKHSSAMECERTCNHLIDAYAAIRCVQVCQALWFRTYTMSAVFLLALGLLAWRLKVGHQYLDATNLWREVKKSEKEAIINIVIDAMIIVIGIVVMVFSTMDYLG